MTDGPTPWFTPSALREQEARDISAVGAGTFDGKSDFGSYYAYSRGHHPEWMRSRGIVGTWAARRFAADIRQLSGLPKGATLCDLGCGLGVVTAAWSRELGARATGVDISQTAVAYARHAHPGANFVEMGIEPDSVLPERYDVIHAKAFYPFTRTGDAEIHNGYLAFCARHLKPGGFLLVIMGKGTDEPGLLQSIARSELEYAEHGLTPFVQYRAAFTKLRNCLPIVAARAASQLIHIARPGTARSILCVSRRMVH